MTHQMIVRIEPELKTHVEKCARAEGKNISQIVRELLKNYLHDHDISSYIDTVWEKIGKKINRRAKNQTYLNNIIKKVRQHDQNRH